MNTIQATSCSETSLSSGSLFYGAMRLDLELFGPTDERYVWHEKGKARKTPCQMSSIEVDPLFCGGNGKLGRVTGIMEPLKYQAILKKKYDALSA